MAENCSNEFYMHISYSRVLLCIKNKVIVVSIAVCPTLFFLSWKFFTKNFFNHHCLSSGILYRVFLGNFIDAMILEKSTWACALVARRSLRQVNEVWIYFLPILNDLSLPWGAFWVIIHVSQNLYYQHKRSLFPTNKRVSRNIHFPQLDSQ